MKPRVMPLAERGWGERGFGRYALYSPLAAAEFYASYSLVPPLSVESSL